MTKATFIIFAAAFVGTAAFTHWIVSQPFSVNAQARSDGPSTPDEALRTQVELYRTQHANTPPRLEVFWQQLSLPTNVMGQTSELRSDDFPFGPYVQGAVANPLN